MDYTLLGRTGVEVSRLCMGTMTFGREADEEMTARIYRRCREAGITFFDCANVYGRGQAETLLGQLIATERDDLVISSKVGMAMGPRHNDQGLSRRHILQQCELSLRRLRTDRLDVYFAHRYDEQTPIDETLRAFDTLVQQGKVLFPAVSNWSAWQTATGLERCDRQGLAPIHVLQPMYNLVKRQAEVEILALAADRGLAVTPYSPMGGGLLSGKYTRSQRPDTGRMVEQENYSVRYGEAAYYDVAEGFTKLAREVAVPPAALAVAWVMHHPAVTAPIIGARNLDQLEQTLKAVEVDMSDELRARISSLSPEPPPATDRSEER